MAHDSDTHDHDEHSDHDHEGHDHSHASGLGGHGHFHFHGDQAPRLILRAASITIAFMIIELVGGWWANSIALISDGAHMLTDVGALFLTLFALWVARKPTTARMSFGYHRAEILGALGSGLVIWLISGALVFEAIRRLHEAPAVNGPIVLVVAFVGLIANLLSMRMLHSEREHNINVRAAYLHLLTDSLGSVSAIIAGAVITWTGWRLIDPIVTIVFAALMLYGSWSLVREAVSVLMESTPAGIDPSKVQAALAAIPGVREVHDLHIWSVSSGRLALSAHLIADSSESILAQAHTVLREKHGIQHTTIQIERPDLFNTERCYDCAPVTKAQTGKR